MDKFIFDLDGTLLNADFSFEIDYFASVLDKGVAKEFDLIRFPLLTEYENSHYKYDIMELSEFFYSKSGINITPLMIKEWIRRGANCSDTIIDGVEEVLKYLKSKNKKIVLLTNWFSECQLSRLKRAGIYDYFDEFYCGDSCLKPNLDSYKLACGNTPYDRCVIIGDTFKNDVLAPSELGITAIYFCPNGDGIEFENKIDKLIKIKEMF